MFCSKCGKEIDDEAVICPNCGCKTNNFNKVDKVDKVDNTPDEPTMAMTALSLLIPIVGVIMGIIYLCQKKNQAGMVYLICGIVGWIICLALILGL